MSYKDLSKKDQNAYLKQMREELAESVQQSQDLLKTQNQIRKQIKDAFEGESRTVPQIAEKTGLAKPDVLWHVTAMKKYEEVVEDGMEGFYDVLYKLVEEK